MGGWPSLLFDFRKAMEAAEEEMEAEEPQSSGSSLVNLLRLVTRSNRKVGYSSVENNFLYTALHINTLNSISFPANQLPDLPSDILKSDYA
jgi:hypothetical protein